MDELKNLSSVEDLKRLGDYCDFDFDKNVEGDFTRIYASVKEGRSKLVWLVKPIGGVRRKDIKATSFYITAREGIVGLLYKSRTDDKKYRIVLFDRPLKRLPRISKKLRKRTR
jgi:hypothetical protein